MQAVTTHAVAFAEHVLDTSADFLAIANDGMLAQPCH